MFTVWSKPSSASHINIVKCLANFKGVDPEVLYDTLHDAEYRAVWDENMIEVLSPFRAFTFVSFGIPGAHRLCRARSSSSSTLRTRSATTVLRYAPRFTSIVVPHDRAIPRHRS